MKTPLKILILLFLLMFNLAFGQDIKSTRDIGLWTSLSLEYKFNKKWRGTATQEIRTFNNALRFQKSISDFEVDYKLNKQFKLGGGLRYAYNREKDYSFSHNIRYNLDLKFKGELAENFDFQYRLRYQSNYEDPFTGFSDFEQNDKVRNRLKITYDLNKHSIYFGAELFREHVNYRKPSFNIIRFTVGDAFETGKGEFKYGLGYERELTDENPLNYYFLRLNYTISLKHD